MGNPAYNWNKANAQQMIAWYSWELDNTSWWNLRKRHVLKRAIRRWEKKP